MYHTKALQKSVRQHLRNAFAQGVGSTVSIFGGYCRFTPGRSDAEAIAGDWRRVGSHLSEAATTKTIDTGR